MPRCRPFAAFLPMLALAVHGCKGPAYGSDNAVIAVVDPALRDTLEPLIRRSFEREVFTTRPEPVFEVTFARSDDMGEFRKWKRILVVEPADGEAQLVPELLDGDEMAAARGGGVVAEVEDKWARNQTIWVVSAPTPEATVDLARGRVDSLYRVIHDRFAASAVERMWASEPDSALAEALLDSLGFALVLPRVYTPAPASAPPATVTYYNEDPRRVVSIHWTRPPAVLTPDSLLAIRRAWGRQIFAGDSIPEMAAPDDTLAQAAPLLVSETSLGGRPAIRLQGVWLNRRDSTAGVFITYAVLCGDRLVLLDGNVFAPDRPKYPYIIQMERIFETFRCTAGDRG